MRRNLQFKVNYERQIFEKPFYLRFICSQSFCESYAESNSQKKCRVIHFVVSKVNVNKTHVTFFLYFFIVKFERYIMCETLHHCYFLCAQELKVYLHKHGLSRRPTKKSNGVKSHGLSVQLISP